MFISSYQSLKFCQATLKNKRFHASQHGSEPILYMKKILTLCIVYQYPKILLGYKKRGFGKGRWNGFGGKVKNGENIKEAIKRELHEETGIITDDVELMGILEFEFKNKSEILEVHIFRSTKFSGEPKESEEMKPAWFHIDKIPFNQMWPDDIYWMPLFLYGKKFKGKFWFEGMDKIIDKKLFEVKRI